MSIRPIGFGASAIVAPGGISAAVRTVKAATDACGRIDILVNNTGAGNYKNLEDTRAEDYDEMVDTNVHSTFLFTLHAVPVMLERNPGTILTISSMAGISQNISKSRNRTTTTIEYGNRT